MSAALLAAVLLLLFPGCPGKLADPERFASTPQADAQSCELDIDVEQDLLVPRCSGGGCHAADNPAAGLDLASPNPGDRLLGAPSSQCDGEMRIDPSAPADSYFVHKLEGPVDGCGDRMPAVGAPLTDQELQCVRVWARDLAGGTPADAGVLPSRDAATGTTP